MMKKSNLIYCLGMMILIGSCSVNNDVVSGGIFQKRKYNKGVNISIKKKIEKENNSIEGNVSYAESSEKENVSTVVSQPDKENLENLNAENSISAVENEIENNVILDNENNKVNKGQKNDVKSKSNWSTFTNRGNRGAIASKKKTSTKRTTLSPKPLSNSVALIIGLIISIIFLPPLGVGIALGFDVSEFKTNLWLFLGGLILVIVGVLMAFIVWPVAVALYAIGGILLFVSWVHGIIVIVREF